MASPERVKLDFVTLDVFTSTPFLGNPLAVVFVPASQRARVDQDTKQRIAREFNLSETVFLHTLDNEPDRSATVREMDIFLPTRELPFAGHPTIGTAYLVLRHLGWDHVDTLRTKAGPIRITPVRETGGVMAAIPQAVRIHRQTLGDVVGSLSADARAAVDDALATDPEIRAAELAAPAVTLVDGMAFVLVRLPSLEHLARLSAKQLPFERVGGLVGAEGGDDVGFVSRYHYVVTAESTADDGTRRWAIQARNVELGFEDPATGSAASTLASYLTLSAKATQGAEFAITQGVEMGRHSDITIRTAVDAKGDQVKITELEMGGKAVVVMNGSIDVN